MISPPLIKKLKMGGDVAGFKKIITWQTKVNDFAMIFLNRLANHKGKHAGI